MSTFAWLTDPHLNFLNRDQYQRFLECLAQESVDGLFITGDIAESDSLVPLLDQLVDAVSYPVYVVLGNHDYYRGSIAGTRALARTWSRAGSDRHWLPDSPVLALSPQTALIGHGGWGDGQIGDFMGSGIWLNDYVHISDLTGCTKGVLLERLKRLGLEAADFLESQLRAALQQAEQVILLTHVPPYLEACWHEGRIECNEWTPHFTCEAVGERLRTVMNAHPDQSLHVLCGHTHSGGVVDILPNLRVTTGGAVYRAPALQEPIYCV